MGPNRNRSSSVPVPSVSVLDKFGSVLGLFCPALRAYMLKWCFISIHIFLRSPSPPCKTLWDALFLPQLLHMATTLMLLAMTIAMSRAARLAPRPPPPSTASCPSRAPTIAAWPCPHHELRHHCRNRCVASTYTSCQQLQPPKLTIQTKKRPYGEREKMEE